MVKRKKQSALRFERLEARAVLAAGLDSNHNAWLPEDANGSGEVTPLDALVVINEIARSGPAVTVTSNSMADVNADGSVTPLDALMILNRISRVQSGGSEISAVPLEVRIERLASDIENGALPSNLDPTTAVAMLEMLKTGQYPEVTDDLVNVGSGEDIVDDTQVDDELMGATGIDQVRGGDGIDKLYGDAGTDSLWGGFGKDMFDGGTGGDQLVGGEGLDLEVDTGDRFADGDTDGDGYDNDYDYLDILYEVPGNPPAFADDASVAPIIAALDGEVRNFLNLSAADTGLRVRVQASQFGDRVTGVWRYLTPDKIQVWGKWAYPTSDPSQVTLAVQWSYGGPSITLDQIDSGDVADYLNPANYSISEESRVYAGFLNGPGGFLVNWLPGTPANFGYWAPSEEALAYWFPGTGPAIGVPAPIEAVKAALASLPNFTDNGDSFTADFSTAPGFPGVQPVLDVLRTINRVTRASRQQLAP